MDIEPFQQLPSLEWKILWGAKEIQWVETNPKIIRAARLISRLRNDTVAREVQYPFI